MQPNTYTLLLIANGWQPMAKLEDVAKQYLPPSTLYEMNRKARNGELPFPVSIEGKGKSASYLVPLDGVAKWLDKRTEEANNDYLAMQA